MEPMPITQEAWKFQYYVNFYGKDRRLDNWVEEDEIMQDEENINREVKNIEEIKEKEKDFNNNFLQNDENNGMKPF